MRIGVLVLAFGLSVGAAFATEPEPLDQLFEKLAKAESAETAVVLEARIWEEWLKSGSPSVDLIMTRGLNAIQEEDFDTALEFFTAASEIKPDFAEAWNKRATVNYLKGDYDKALIAIGRALKIEPRHFAALTGLGRILESYGEKAKALEAYRRALALDPHLEGVQESIDRLKVEVEGRGI